MATMDRPDGNDRVPGSDGYDYIPKGYQNLTMEQQLRIKVLLDQASHIKDKYKMFELLADALVLNMNQINTFKKLMKDSPLPNPDSMKKYL